MADAVEFDATTITYVGEMLRYISLSPQNTEVEKLHKIKNGFGPGLRPDVWEKLMKRFGNIHFAELYGSSEGFYIFF